MDELKPQRNISKALIPLLLLCLVLVSTPSLGGEVFALETASLPGVAVTGDFVVGPAKIEILANPGEEKTAEFNVTNRTGREHRFTLTVVDFEGSNSLSEQAVTILENVKGKRSLKDLITLPQAEFTLSHGERAIIPITLNIPADELPGGKFAAVMVSMLPAGEVSATNVGAEVISRIGVLLFTTVTGDFRQEGILLSVKTKNNQRLFWKPTVPIQLFFENTGDTHLNPYGAVVVKNMLGATSQTLELEPWFVLPDSTRAREVLFEKSSLFGWYKVSAQINRGYEDIVDEVTTSFFVLPLREILLAFLVATIFFIVRRCNKKVNVND
jgi:hypothetical protein